MSIEINFPPNQPSPPPPVPGSPSGQPVPPAPTPQKPTVASTLPVQPTIQPQYPNLDGKVHPEVALAIRNLHSMVFDLQAGVTQLSQQLQGGAMATATLSGTGLASIVLTSGGYYLKTPVVSFEGGSVVTPGSAHAVLTGNRVTSVVIDTIGDYGAVPTVVFTVQ